MKKFLFAIGITLLSMFTLSSSVLARPIVTGTATYTVLSDSVFFGGASVGSEIVRVGAQFGSEGRTHYTLDLTTNTSAGVYFGGGLYADRWTHRGNTLFSGWRDVTFGEEKFGLSPSIVIGTAQRRGFVAESRVIFNEQFENQVSLGIRF